MEAARRFLRRLLQSGAARRLGTLLQPMQPMPAAANHWLTRVGATRPSWSSQYSPVHRASESSNSFSSAMPVQ